jgi:hypothetical protein
MRPCPGYVFFWLLTALFAASAGAEGDPVLLEQKVRIGAPARELTLAVRSQGHVTLTVSGRRHELATQNVSAARLELVQLTRDAAIAIIRLSAAETEWAAIVGGRQGTELIAFARTDLHGDPGERRALGVEVGEPDAKGERSVSFGTRHEALSLCGRPALTERKQIDPKSLSARPAPWLPGELPAQPLTASTPGDLPLVRALEAQGSSALDPIGAPQPPRPLVDRGQASFAVEPHGFVTLRGAIAGLTIERVELRFASAQRPKELWLLGEENRALRVTVPESGDAAAIALEPAWPSRCLALLLGAGKQAGPVALAEVVAYTSVDRAGGPDGLMSRVVQGGAEAEQSLAVLGSLGPLGARALAARFDELGERNRLRVLPLLARAADDPPVAARLLAAARRPELREAAFSAIQQGGQRTRPLLRELARDATQGGDEAARRLARDVTELPALLAALGHEGNAGRPELRRAIANTAQRAPEPAAQAVKTWLGASPPVAARLSLVLALAPLEVFRGLVSELAQASLGALSAFEDRYRLALAAPLLAASPGLDTWLEQQLGAEEWMMRHAAFAALEARAKEKAAQQATRLAGDPYPRVRAAALPSLAAGAGRAQVANLARQDSWPLVRVAAVKALATHVDQRSVLRAALEDGSHGVRAAAIEALATQRDGEAWPEVRAHLQAPAEWPDVRGAAIDYAASLCRAEAHEDLVALVRRALRPDAQESDQALGMEAFEALVALGGAAAEDARKLAGRDGSPQVFRRLLESSTPRCGAPRG